MYIKKFACFRGFALLLITEKVEVQDDVDKSLGLAIIRKFKWRWTSIDSIVAELSSRPNKQTRSLCVQFRTDHQTSKSDYCSRRTDLNAVVGANEILIHSLEPSHIIVRVRYEMHVQLVGNGPSSGVVTLVFGSIFVTMAQII